MTIPSRITSETSDNNREVYKRAIARLEKELGWTPSKAHEVIAGLAQAHGVFLDDVAQAIIRARTVRCGLARVIGSAQFDRRPLAQRAMPAR